MEDFLRFEHRLFMSKVRLSAKIRPSRETAMAGKHAAHTPSFCLITWHSPYNCRKKHRNKPQSG